KSQNQPILVVVSACAGVTDRLVMLANESDNVESILSEIVHRHTEIADELSRLNRAGAVEKQLAL
ncbi:MAG TPA: lysine-sensitive aspartokinase 3, partial [Idiomarina sp.]|nr:lysine-sensitive aspartokinase 3 [Idiomarina sp.]